MPLDFHELWHNTMSTHLISEVKQPLAMLALGCVTIRVLGQVFDVSNTEFVSFLLPEFHKFYVLLAFQLFLQVKHVDCKNFSNFFFLLL